MAGIRERKYKANGKTKTYYEISWYYNGKQYKKGGFATKIDAQLALSSVLSHTSTDIKFGALAQNYIDKHCKLNCKNTTKQLYQSYLNNYLEPIKNRQLKEIKKTEIEYIILNLKENELSNKTINCVINFIKAVFNYGIDNEFINKNIMTRFKTLPLEKPPIQSLNEVQQNIFLEQAKKSKYYAFFATALLTGMRISEIAGLEWTDIDFKRNLITVNKQIYRGIKTSTKTNKERVIDMPNNLIEILKEHKLKNNYLCKLVFHNGNGQPVHTCSIKENYFHPLIKECNKYLDLDNQIINFRFHDLRHSYATYLLSNGVSIKYVQEKLGHASAKMTLDIYAKYMPSVKSGALQLLENIAKKDKKEHKKNIEN